MAAAAEERLGDRLIEGLAIAPASLASGPAAAALRSRVIGAAHPLPDATSVAAARAALELASRAQPGELLMVALSGGASALLALPAGAVTLADKIAITSALMRAGATIRELNIVRKHLSAIKGGRLLAATHAGVEVLQSDSFRRAGSCGRFGASGDDWIGTDGRRSVDLQRRDRRAEAASIWGRAPEAVRDHLERGAAGELGETVKAADSALARVTNLIVGDNRMAVDAAAEAASALGYDVVQAARSQRRSQRAGLRDRAASERNRHRAGVPGGGRRAGRHGYRRWAGRARAAMRVGDGDRIGERRGWAQSGGAIRGHGRDRRPDRRGGGDRDAGDGRAGGRSRGRCAGAALARNDAYGFFKALGDLVIIGPTGTNVADLMVALVNY